MNEGFAFPSMSGTLPRIATLASRTLNLRVCWPPRSVRNLVQPVTYRQSKLRNEIEPQGAGIEYGTHQICGPALVRRPQYIQEQILVANRSRFAIATALTSPTIRVCQRACDLEQALLIRLTDDLTAEQPRLACAPDVSRRKTARGHAKHRQIRFLVADCDRLSVGCQDPVAQGPQAAAFVDLLGPDRGIDRRVMEAKSIKSQVLHQMPYKEARQRGQSAIADAVRAHRFHQGGKQASRLFLIRESPNRILVTIVEEHSGYPPQVPFQLVQLARGFRTDQNLPALMHGIPQITAVLGDAAGQGVGLAVGFHFGHRARRIHRDGKSVGVQQSEGLHACRRGARKAE